MNSIFNKSCEDMSEILDETVDLVVTSPPYFSLKEYATWETYESYLSFIKTVSEECSRVVKPGGWVAWNVQDSIPFPSSATGKERYSKPLAADSINTFLSSGFCYEKGIVWYKGEGTATQRLFGSYPMPGLILISGLTEQILLFRKQRNGYKRIISDEVKQKSLLTKEEWSEWALDHWKIRPVSAKKVGHPAPYPEEIPYRLIKLFSFYGDTVLDPFFGSGTTSFAAERCGRECIGYEIHQEYIDLYNSRKRYDINVFDS